MDTGGELSELDQIMPGVMKDSAIVPDALKRLLAIYKASLKANRKVLKGCLTKDESGRTICRFCGPGIPNWRATDGREHGSDCPMVCIGEVLKSNRDLIIELTAFTKRPGSLAQDNQGDNPGPD